jgi:hydrogenase maturation protease
VSNNPPAAVNRDFLVIGYGNTLRGDDGVGPRVVEAIEKLNLPGVRTLICQQLSPEYADLVSRAHTVVFVDAAVDTPKEVQLRKIEPSESAQLMAHAADPRTMLALARAQGLVADHSRREAGFQRNPHAGSAARLCRSRGKNSGTLPLKPDSTQRRQGAEKFNHG